MHLRTVSPKTKCSTRSRTYDDVLEDDDESVDRVGHAQRDEHREPAEQQQEALDPRVVGGRHTPAQLHQQQRPPETCGKAKTSVSLVCLFAGWCVDVECEAR